MTTKLTSTHLRFDLIAQDPIHLDGYKAGHHLRGALGNVMLRSTCPDGQRKSKPDPAHAAVCPVCWLLAADTEPGYVRRVYSLVPPIPALQTVDSGERFSFVLTLYGQALQFLPYFVLAIPSVGHEGIGPGRGRFDLDSIWAIDPFTQQEEVVLAPGENLVQMPEIRTSWTNIEAILPGWLSALKEDNQLTIQFLTPTRLIESRKTVKIPDFGVFFRRLLERFDQLGQQFAAGTPRSQEEVQHLYHLADCVRLVDAATGEIVYMPPEAVDVPDLMREMVHWIHQTAPEYPIPVIAGIAHYQFVTVHPFYDGNGRTARTLTPWILYQGGYALGKFYALEEFYAEDLTGYYEALVTHPHHNYYFGRHEADITPWLDYFLKGMAVVFERVAQEVERRASEQAEDAVLELLRPLAQRARRVLGLFAQHEMIVSSYVANLLGISVRQARDLLTGWVAQGWLEVADPSRRGRKYRLADRYHELLN